MDYDVLKKQQMCFVITELAIISWKKKKKKKKLQNTVTISNPAFSFTYKWVKSGLKNKSCGIY